MRQKEWNPDRIFDQLTMRAIERRRPLTAMFELTYRCNFNCKMCYVHMTDEQAKSFGRMRTVEEWLDMARQLKEAGVLNLKLTGGECTQYPGFNVLYEQLAQMGFRLHILSNAGYYTEAQRELFRQYPPYSVSITLYGASPETYKAVTGDAGGFDRVVKNIRFFQSIGVHLGIGFTIIKQNVLDYPKIDALSRELGIPLACVSAIYPHLRDAGISDAVSSRLTPAQRVCVERNYPKDVEQALADAIELEKELEHFSLPVLSEEEIPEQLSTCVGSYSSCSILWNGEMTTCLGLTGFQKYYPFEVGFETAWQHLQADYNSTFKTPKQCLRCALQRICHYRCQGMCNSFTGNGHIPDLEICKYTWLMHRYQQKLGENTYPLPISTSPCA